MRKFSLVGLVMALCILFSCSLVQAQDLRTISVDGSSTIKVAPDKATISISIENTAKDAKLASAQNAQIMQNIQSAILGLAITKDKMQTTNYNLYPVYNTKDNSREIIGYSVSNEITVIIDNIDMVGTVIDTAINAGASNVNSIEFGLKDSQVYKDKVLQQAIADAKRKAQVVANSLGKSIVNVVSVNTGSTYIEAKNFNNAMYMRAADATGATSPIQSGDISVRANVSVVFEMN